ncbi:TrmH family RNA methyltransferase [Winogradskyella immobilis]|uniref:RNA methyltransferase n=1 Tax=Winogradskyella immobilis TaxID=2816852 RepID=A0ABS8EQK5_9FLAO|nr:RNA methyltransferase [Winogradskyella immobilis]MCC1485156.1 RNA methyltransferase [Winogradskyella immobilis]MCG0017248.1 RNA methyltransferase [Winogradskyella immobilis]
MNKLITSVSNPLIKQLFLLKEKARERKRSEKFLIEGKRELSLAIKAGYAIETLLFFPDLFSESEASAMAHYNIDSIEISKVVFQKLAHRDTTEGIIAVVKSKSHKLDALKLKQKNPLILVAEAPEKPGNIGALLRTADAANVDAVIIANPKSDLYNPNIIRSSVGCVFTTEIAMATSEEVITYLQQYNFNIFSAILQESEPYYTQDYTLPTAIVVGTEATGLTQEWRNAAKQNISIPMQGIIDSMNVSVAAGILIFEAKRQRNFE